MGEARFPVPLLWRDANSARPLRERPSGASEASEAVLALAEEAPELEREKGPVAESALLIDDGLGQARALRYPPTNCGG